MQYKNRSSSTYPIDRDPGSFQVGNIEVRGIAIRHADAETIRKSGGDAFNTIWIIKIAGKKILHLGDTPERTDAELSSIVPVDNILTNPEKFERIDSMKAVLKADSIIPMHYRLPSNGEEGAGNDQRMNTVDKWRVENRKAARLTGSSHKLSSLVEEIK